MDKYFEMASRIEKALCIHRESKGSPDYLQETPDGQVHCIKCGRDFKPINMNDDSVALKIEERCKDIIDVIETMKFEDPNLDREYKLIIPLLEELPNKFMSSIEKKENKFNSDAINAFKNSMSPENFVKLCSGFYTHSDCNNDHENEEYNHICD